MSRAELQALVHDLRRPSPPTYWLDFALSWSTAAVTFGLALAGPPALLARWVWLIPCTCATYRMTLFTHELTHLSKGAVPGFRIVWNLLCGIPLLIPSFLYETHLTHHDRRTYGTAADGEYLAFAATPRVQAVGSVLATVLALPALVLRFLVVAPLGLLFPALRRLAFTRASTLNIDFRATRAVPNPLPRHWTLQELGCLSWCVVILLLLRAGVLSWGTISQAGAVLTGAVFLNALRVLCAHRYPSREPRSFAEQVLDSNDFPHGWAWIWAPLGLRYHAMHHLFPSLPYHALGEAYRRVRAALPEDSPLRGTSRASFPSAFNEVVGLRRTRERVQ